MGQAEAHAGSADFPWYRTGTHPLSGDHTARWKGSSLRAVSAVRAVSSGKGFVCVNS